MEHFIYVFSSEDAQKLQTLGFTPFKKSKGVFVFLNDAMADLSEIQHTLTSVISF